MILPGKKSNCDFGIWTHFPVCFCPDQAFRRTVYEMDAAENA